MVFLCMAQYSLRSLRFILTSVFAIAEQYNKVPLFRKKLFMTSPFMIPRRRKGHIFVKRDQATVKRGSISFFFFKSIQIYTRHKHIGLCSAVTWFQLLTKEIKKSDKRKKNTINKQNAKVQT